MAASLIDELQIDSANSATPVSSLLRKALMVASKLGVSDIPEWINHELSGYPDFASLPAYRKVHGHLMTRQWRGGWVPAQLPTDELQNMASQQSIFESIAALEGLDARDGTMTYTIPIEGQQILQNAFRHEAEFRIFIDKSVLRSVFDEVRNRVLRWTIALEKAGIKGEGLAFTGPEKERAHSMIFHADSGSITIGVAGSAVKSNVATGDHAHAGDLDAEQVGDLVRQISSHVSSLGLPPASEAELRSLLAKIAEDTTGKAKPTGLKEALGRVLSLVGKAGNTVITAGIAAYTEAWMRRHGLT